MKTVISAILAPLSVAGITALLLAVNASSEALGLGVVGATAVAAVVVGFVIVPSGEDELPPRSQ